MAEHFTNSIGFLQQTALPSNFQGFERVSASPPAQPQEGTIRACLFYVINQYFNDYYYCYYYYCFNGNNNNNINVVEALHNTGI